MLLFSNTLCLITVNTRSRTRLTKTFGTGSRGWWGRGRGWEWGRGRGGGGGGGGDARGHDLHDTQSHQNFLLRRNTPTTRFPIFSGQSRFPRNRSLSLPADTKQCIVRGGSNGGRRELLMRRYQARGRGAIKGLVRPARRLVEGDVMVTNGGPTHGCQKDGAG